MIRFALLACVLAACVPSPVPPPTPPDASDAASPPTVDATPAPLPVVELPDAMADATPEAAPAPVPPATPCQAACAALVRLGCPEGKAANCVAVLGHLDAARTSATPNGSPVTCKALSHVHTVAEARAQLPAGHSCGL